MTGPWPSCRKAGKHFVWPYPPMQGTKPQTLAYGLNDSPVGLTAWIVEKWRTWSDCTGRWNGVLPRRMSGVPVA